MSVQLTADRVRSMIEGCRCNAQVYAALKAHKVKYQATPYSDGYALNIRIPCKTGCIRVYRSCSRRSPYVVQHLVPVMMVYSGVPTYRPSVPAGAVFTGY